MKHSIHCRCEHEFEIDVPDQINAAKGSEARSEILDGNFLSYVCERCGNDVRPDLRVTIIPEQGSSPIDVIPERERDRFLFESGEKQIGSQIVIGRLELRERFLILEAGYDFQAIEAIKYQILVRASGSKDIRIYFEAKNDDQFEFSIHGLREDEIAMIKLPESSYTQALSDITDKRDNEPYKTLLDGAYNSVHKLEIETDS